MKRFRLKGKVTGEGVGLHGGTVSRVTFHPREEYGVFFLKNGTRIPAGCANVADTRRGVTLEQNGQRVKTVEHLLAAVGWIGVSGVEIGIEGEEIPVMDGSALPWVALLKPHLAETGDVFPEKRIASPVFVEEGDAWVRAEPSDSLSIRYEIAFPDPVGRQVWEGEVTPRIFEEELAPARTFGFVEEAASLRREGLAMGGDLNTCVVITRDLILTPLRYRDEMVRHKVLDLLGDLALLGWIPKMRIEAHKASHRLHTTLARILEAELKKRHDG